jgi:nucleoside-diphosphate-sugar epimerase
MPGDVVCVTGASGFIALHLIQQLLEKGLLPMLADRFSDNSVEHGLGGFLRRPQGEGHRA